uniref:Ig-like domain-containing protein n=1 Tax=Podarcis muralis TaxID=64176 RepID=A0A670JKK3_PODMU
RRTVELGTPKVIHSNPLRCRLGGSGSGETRLVIPPRHWFTSPRFVPPADPSGALWGGQASATPPPWLSLDASEAESSCEINAYAPQESHFVPWAEGLEDGGGCPRALERGKWLIASIQAPDAEFGVSSVLHTEEALPWKQQDGVSSVTTTAAVLSVFTRTPRLESRLGRPAVLHCGFSAPASAFSVEWRHQFRGAGKVVLAFDGASRGVSVAEEGAELLLDAEGGGASLRLWSVAVRHEGTYICTVYLPHLHAQQALEFKVVEPPQVTLRPTTLSVPPGARPQLACEVSGFFPLGASVSWKRRGSGAPQDAFLDIGDSGHRQAPDGTFSFTSFARLLSVPTEDHGVSYVCHVGHAGLGEAGVKKAVVLHVAGSLGPSLEDAIGLFLVAIVLLGVLRSFFRWGKVVPTHPFCTVIFVINMVLFYHLVNILGDTLAEIPGVPSDSTILGFYKCAQHPYFVDLRAVCGIKMHDENTTYIIKMRTKTNNPASLKSNYYNEK